MAVDLAPGHPNVERTLAVARILRAVSVAIEKGSDATIQRLAAHAGRYLRHDDSSDAVLWRTRAQQAICLRGFLDRYWPIQSPLISQRTSIRYAAAGFVAFAIASGSHFQLELAKYGVAIGQLGGPIDQRWISKVAEAFERELVRGSDSERQVEAGLVALGYPKAKARNLFDFESKSVKRRGTMT